MLLGNWFDLDISCNKTIFARVIIAIAYYYVKTSIKKLPPLLF